MKPPPDLTSAITRHRTRIEKRLIRLLDQTGSGATLDDIKTIIFNEEQEVPFIVYVMQLSELFGDEVDADTVIPAIQDAWNYFPHRRFRGSCPAEQMLRHVPGLTPRDLRA
jgi:hypothetical protein